MDHTTTIPPCEVTGPSGTRIAIHPATAADSVADLARGLDLPASTLLAIDGRPVAAHQRLRAAGLCCGSVVTLASPGSAHEPEPPPSTAVLEVAVHAGPACERWIALPPGRHGVGRATSSTIRIDDPAVELHQGILDVATDGSATFTQLTGAFPATVDGLPCRTAHPIDPARVLRLGTSSLAFRSHGESARPAGGAGSVVADDRDPWRRVVRRGPAAPIPPIGEPLAVPEPPAEHRSPPATSLAGAGIAAIGAGLLAVVLGQALFAMFAAVGAIASFATWAIGALGARRARRRARVQHRAARLEFDHALVDAHRMAACAHRARHRGIVDALEAVHGDGSTLWPHRCGPDGVLTATLGVGDVRWSPPISGDDRDRLDADLVAAVDRCGWLVDVAVPIALERSSVIAFCGRSSATTALCRSVIVQLAADVGPADWELQVVTHDPHAWSWVSWLPQTRGGRGVLSIDDSTALADLVGSAGPATGGGRRTVIVLESPALLSARTGPLRRRLDRGDATCLVLVPPGQSVPAIASRVLEIGDTGVGRWVEADARGIAIAGLSAAAAESAARRLAPLIDPEDHDDSAGLAASVSLAELEPVAEDASAVIARRWALAGADPAPIARLGTSGDGIIDVDLARDGPHGLIAGTTGSGKSELLRTLVVSLAAHAGPDHLTMILVDFKGGSTFDACARLPHTVGVVTDLDDGLAERMLVSLDAEVRRREQLFRAARAVDLADYRRVADEPLPRLVVVVDEFASLAKELPDFLGTLVSIAQRGRSLGIHLLLATQRPAGVVTDDIRANTNLRIALRLHDRADAADVVGADTPARFPVGLPGRAALRLGPDELVVFQTASASGPAPQRAGRLRVEVAAPACRPGDPSGPSVLDQLVDAICGAATALGTERPRRPWLDALPRVLRPSDLDDHTEAVGLLDDPANQCRRPLRWTPDDGNLLLVGSLGAGTTTAALAVAASAVRGHSADARHLYVVDAHGDEAWSSFVDLEHCGAVVRVSETERLTRLFDRLAGELDRRARDGGREPAVVLVIDGVEALRDALGDVAHGATAMRLERVLRDGPAVGVVSVVTTDGSSAKGLAVARSATWVFRTADRDIARAAGLRGTAWRPELPGRLRVVESGLEAQVVLDPRPLRARVGAPRRRSATWRPGAPPPVTVLPERVDAATLDGAGAGRGAPGEPIELVIGLGADDLEPARLRLPVGDHLFVGGGARTGRSTALRQLEAAWRCAVPGGTVVTVDRRRPLDSELEATEPLLVVVDDAERVDDPDGRLARLATRPGVTLAVAARLEAVRVAYDHWTRAVARSRCGLLFTSTGDVDGELLGVTLPRRPWVAPRPGLAWLVDPGGQRLVQVAARMPP